MGFNNGNSSFGFGGSSSSGGGGGGLTQVITTNTSTFSFYGQGTAGNPLCGCPILSACSGNALSVCSDGLYATDNNSAVIVLGSGSFSSVRCGVNNTASGNYSGAFGGQYNLTCANYSNIVGGDGNVANSCRGGSIGGGTMNYLGISTTLSSYSSNIDCIIFSGDVTAQFNVNDQIYGYNNPDSQVRFGCVTGSSYSGGSTILCTTTNFGTASSIVVRNLTTSSQYGRNTFISGGSYNTSSGDYSFNGNGKFNSVNGSYSLIGNGNLNTTSNFYSTILNGLLNSNQGQYSSIINGRNNSISSSDCFNTILNGSFNTICNTNASSCNNTISGYFNTIRGTDLRLNTIFGCSNVICNTGFACVGNNTIVGYSNTISFCNATGVGLARGEGNFVSGFLNNIVGASKLRNAIFGERNCIIDSINQPSDQGGNTNFVVGSCNCVSGTFGANFIGGSLNTICVSAGPFDNYLRASILGGCRNCIVNGNIVHIVGGRCNCINMGAGAGLSGRSFIGGGQLNTLNQYPNESAILSGTCNILNGSFSSSIIDSGCSNTITTGLGFIGNGCLNTVSNLFGSVLSGCGNVASGIYSSVISGCVNTSSGEYSTIISGEKNLAQGNFSFIGSGVCNNVCNITSGCCALGSVVVGGVGNNTTGGTWDITTCTFTVAPTICNSGQYSFIGGGFQNRVQSSFSSVVGGCCNVTTSNYSAILGGKSNNTSTFCDSFIIGSCLTASQSCTTFVNCISTANIPSGQAVCVTTNNVLVGYTPNVAGLFSQTGTSTNITGTTTETSLIDGGVGSLSVPSNGFIVGNSFNAVMSGQFSSANSETLRIRIKAGTGGAITLLDSGAISMPNITNDTWTLNTTFTIRQIGASTVASIFTYATFTYHKSSNGNVEGFSFEGINNTTFDTTISNTLDITAQWGSNNATNSIFSEIFVLNKTY